MDAFEIIFADPLTAATYLYGAIVCLSILLACGASGLRRPTTITWTPALRAAFERR